MGYRSEVSIIIPNEAFKELVAKAEAENDCVYAFIKNNSLYQTDKFTTMYFHWVKWYEDYGDVQFIEDFMRNVPYVFKRIGEEYDDIDSHEDNITDYDIYDCVGIIRTLDVESAGEKIMIDGKGVETDGFKQQAE